MLLPYHSEALDAVEDGSAWEKRDRLLAGIDNVTDKT